MKSKSKRGQATRQKILEAASARIAKYGVNGTSVDDILKASETGKSQFYHYFGSKDLMVRDLIVHWTANMPWMDTDALRGFTSLGELEVWISDFSRLYQKGELAHGCPIGNLANELGSHHKLLGVSLRQVFLLWTQALAESLATLHKSGQICLEESSEHAAQFILEALQGALLASKLQGDHAPLDRLKLSISRYLSSSSRRSGAVSARPARPARAPRDPKQKRSMGFCP